MGTSYLAAALSPKGKVRVLEGLNVNTPSCLLTAASLINKR